MFGVGTSKSAVVLSGAEAQKVTSIKKKIESLIYLVGKGIRKNPLNMESFWKVALSHNHYTFLVHTLFDANSLVCAFTEFF